jgi:hypothetical protein
MTASPDGVQPPAAPAALVLFDGQNLFNGTREVFGETRWRFDPKKLAELVAARLGVTAREIRFFSGIPKWDRHRDVRAFWERKQNDFRADGVEPRFRELRYRGPQDRSGREKGIDVGIALDAFEAVVDGDVEAIIIFSQDNDLDMVPERAEKYLDREAARLGRRRVVRFYSAYPHDPAAEAAARAWTDGDGDRVRVNYLGIGGGKFTWVKIGRADFDACVDEREAALEARKVDLPAELDRLHKKHKKPVDADFDVIGRGGGFIKGRVAAVLRLPSRGVIVFELKTDLLAVKVSDACLDAFEKAIGKTAHARAEALDGTVRLVLIGVED